MLGLLVVCCGYLRAGGNGSVGGLGGVARGVGHHCRGWRRRGRYGRGALDSRLSSVERKADLAGDVREHFVIKAIFEIREAEGVCDGVHEGGEEFHVLFAG